MADTRVQLEVEDWVREHWMAEKFCMLFFRNRLSLSSGGVFDFDAVSQDKTLVACISTSASKTARGKHAVGKLLKLRSDMLFLHLAQGPDRRMIILTERDMYEACQKEKAGGRVPQEIELYLAEIPTDLRSRLYSAKDTASREVTREN